MHGEGALTATPPAVSKPLGYETSHKLGRYDDWHHTFREIARVSSPSAVLVTMSRNLLVESVYPSLVMRHIGAAAKQIGYARVFTRQQSTDRQQADLLAAGVRRDDL